MAITVFDHLPEVSGESSFQQTSFLIQQCIDHNSLEDAVFLSEMLHERVCNDDSLLLFCDCLLRLSRMEEIYDLLFSHPKSNPRLRYLFAKCCYDLKKYEECEKVLVDDKINPAQLHRIFENTLSAPFAGYLLAMVFCQTGRVDLSRNEYSKAIQGNPFMWSAVCKYVQVGGKNTKDLMKPITRPQVAVVISPSPQKKPTKIEKTPGQSVKKTPLITNAPPVKIAAPRKSKIVERVVQVPETRRSLRLFNQDTENACNRGGLTRGSTPRGSKNQGQRTSKTIEKAIEAPLTARKTRETKPLASRSANAMRSLSSSTTSVASSASQSAEVKDYAADESDKPMEEVLKDLYESVQNYCTIEEAIAYHEWSKAISYLDALPHRTNRHSLTMLMRARIMFEMSDYESTKDILQALRREHPHKIEGTELLSTALWQLQDSHALSSLARDLTEHHRRRPQTWCVVGNCFSLQRQHALAVDCMERAVQLDPHFAYAYTLLGHELVFQEDLDKAIKAFRNALNIAPNDYRAWYGLGQVHQKNEQTHLAQANMRKAVEINPTNRGMLCSLAQVEQSLGHQEEAMKLLTRALALNPNDVACRYNRARLLYDMKREQECLQELARLKELSPEEAHIFHLLGKVHRKLNHTHKALLNYSWATEMDPRGEQSMAHGIADNYSDSSYSPDQGEEVE